MVQDESSFGGKILKKPLHLSRDVVQEEVTCRTAAFEFLQVAKLGTEYLQVAASSCKFPCFILPVQILSTTCILVSTLTGKFKFLCLHVYESVRRSGSRWLSPQTWPAPA